MILKKNKKKYFSGFSLLESMLAVFVVTGGMLVVITLISKSLVDSLDSRDQVIASLLAEEGIELVRNVRDNNWMSGVGSFDRNLDYTGYCRISRAFIYANGDTLTCGLGASVSNDYRMYLNESNGAYNHNSTGTVPTRYYRRIQINGSATTRTITSMVVWGSSFPALLTDCSTGNKCAYSQVSLNTWGE